MVISAIANLEPYQSTKPIFACFAVVGTTRRSVRFSFSPAFIPIIVVFPVSRLTAVLVLEAEHPLAAGEEVARALTL